MDSNEKIEQVDEYIYVEQIINPNKEIQTAEIKRLSWGSIWQTELHHKKYPQYPKVKVYNRCGLPAITYGS